MLLLEACESQEGGCYSEIDPEATKELSDNTRASKTVKSETNPFRL